MTKKRIEHSGSGRNAGLEVAAKQVVMAPVKGHQAPARAGPGKVYDKIKFIEYNSLHAS